MMKPRTSVCIPVYQEAPTLVATLRLALAGTRAGFEVVIRDNDSTDDTGDVIAGFGDPRIRLIQSKETLLLPADWRAAVEQTRGELIKMMCIDDSIHPDYLTAQAVLLEGPSLTLVACRRDFIDGNGRILTRSASLPRLLRHRGVSEVARTMVRFGINPVDEPACVMFRRKDYDAIDGFNGLNVFVMDIDAWLRILTRGDMLSQSGTHAAFRIWTESFSNSHSRQQLNDHLWFLKQVANSPRYETPIVLRHLAPTAAHVSWCAWTVRQ